MRKFIKQVAFKTSVNIASKAMTYIIWRGLVLPYIVIPFLGILSWVIS